MKSIPDKVEVSIDFPDKAYMGAFGHESSFDVQVDAEEVLLHVKRTGEERRQVAVHLHYLLLAEILAEIGEGVSDLEAIDGLHRESLLEGTEALMKGLKKVNARRKNKRRQ